MTTPADRQFALARRLTAHRSSGAYDPGRYVFWFLAQHLDPDKILFGDVVADDDQTFNARSGTIFAVTGTAIILVRYENAAEDDERDREQDFGNATLTVYPLTKENRPTVTWASRSLEVPQRRLDRRVGVRGMKGSITCAGTGWEVQLPGEDIDNADEYVRELLASLALV